MIGIAHHQIIDYYQGSHTSIPLANDLPHPTPSLEIAVGDAPVTDVTVHGLPGLWAEHVTTWPPGATINMLFWQEGEFTFMIQSSLLTLNEMLSVANSLN